MFRPVVVLPIEAAEWPERYFFTANAADSIFGGSEGDDSDLHPLQGRL